MRTEKFVKAFQKASRPKTQGYDTQAEVRRVEGGTAWVHIPGGVDETPVKLTIDAKAGDTVQVRVSGGKAFLVGNATAPPTDDTTATRAVQQITETNVVVETVKKAVAAVTKIAGNTNQYFWHTESGTDTGAHITEIPQDEFLADPENGGGNLLARSNGVAVRDGLTELSKFTASGVYLGEDDAVVISPTGATKTVLEDESIGHFSFPATIDLSASAVYSILSDAQTFHLEFLVNGGTADMNFTKGEAHTHEYDGAFNGEYDGESTITVTSHSALLTEGDFFIYAQIEKQGGVFSFGHRSVSDDAGFFSAAFGEGLLASGDEQAVFGRYNEDDPTKAVIIGNGTATGSSANRSNALTVDWSGNVNAAGQVKSKTESYGITLPASVTASTFELVRNGGIAMLSIVNIQSLPAGNTTICRLSSGWRPALDVLHTFNAPAASSSSSDLRVSITTAGVLSIYNYGSAITSTSNKSLTLCYVLA